VFALEAAGQLLSDIFSGTTKERLHLAWEAATGKYRDKLGCGQRVKENPVSESRAIRAFGL